MAPVSLFRVLSGIDWVLVLSFVSVLCDALLQAQMTKKTNNDNIIVYAFMTDSFILLFIEQECCHSQFKALAALRGFSCSTCVSHPLTRLFHCGLLNPTIAPRAINMFLSFTKKSRTIVLGFSLRPYTAAFTFLPILSIQNVLVA